MNLRRFISSGFGGEIAFFAKAKHFGGYIGRERTDLGVKFLYGSIKILAGYLYAVFGTFYLCLQTQEIFVGF
jgi:hypothetical protein